MSASENKFNDATPKKSSLTPPGYDWSAVIATPPGDGEHNWAGAPGVIQHGNMWYCTVRYRRPRGHVDGDRGAYFSILRCDNPDCAGEWTEIKRFTKADFGAASIERSALQKLPGGGWRIFTSFASDAEGTWRIISMETEDDDITKIDASTARELFDLSSLASQGVQGVKDPWLVKDQDMLYMVISVALVDTTLTDEHHGTKDIYNTGLCTSGSALAISNNNGRDWQWHGVILEAPGIDTSWDGYCRRMNCAFQSGGLWFSFYDGIPNEKHNYEEKTGLCMARAITGPWTVHTVQEPLFVSTHATGAMRYFEVQNMGETSIEDGALVFFECAREDGAHELRLARCHTDELIPQEYSALTTLHPGPLCGACDHSGGYTNRRLCTIQ